MKFFVKACGLAALALPVLTGCGGSSSSPTSAPLTPQTTSETLSSGLTAALTEDRTTVPVGGTVNYTITLTNSTSQPITFQPTLGSGALSNTVPAYLEVLDPSGNVVYPVGPSAQVVILGQSVTIAPGQSVSATQAVNTIQETTATIAEGYSRTGHYTATASISLGTTASGNDKPVGPVGVVAQ